jgi:hypothetical protein
MSTEPFLATRLSVLNANDDSSSFLKTNQFRGDQDKKKGKSKAKRAAALAFQIIP